jgi:DNA-directed RNA polymerase specialized sigma subunit
MNELEEYNKFKKWIHKLAFQIWHKNRSRYDVDDVVQEATIGFLYGLRHYKYDTNKSPEENEYLKIAYIKRCVEGFAKNTPTTIQQVHIPGNIYNLCMRYTKE